MDAAEAVAILERLDSTADEAWADAFMEAAERHAARAAAAGREGRADVARTERRRAYGFSRLARYPAPSTPRRRAAYARSKELYLEMARDFDPPLERVRIAFRGRPGEGEAIVADLRVPRTAGRPPVAVLWGGIDSFKEERRTDAYVARGLATLAIDMPGVGDAPIAGAEDAERLWDPIFAWLRSRTDVDGSRVAIGGNSTGGYWAAKLAHTHREHLKAAVDHGGPAHHAFARAWIERSETGEYPFELPETLAAAFGGRTREDWIAVAPRLSLLEQGLLDRRCAPLLLVNGVADSVFPIADMHLLLEHGDPKSARFFPGGHMGDGPTVETIVTWLAERLFG